MKIKDEYIEEINNLPEIVKFKISQLISKIEYLNKITPKNKSLMITTWTADSSGYREEYDIERLSEWGIINFIDKERGYYLNPFIADCEKMDDLRRLLAKNGTDNQDQISEAATELLRTWELVKDGRKACLREKGKVRFVFPTNWSQAYSYFDYLFYHPGKYIDLSVLYESYKGNVYPNRKGENWRVNDTVRRTLNKLKKKQEFQNLPFTIEINKGARLILK